MQRQPVPTVIVEDEFPARKLLEGYLARVPELALVGSYAQPLDALPTLRTTAVGLLLLDINMPVISGIEFLKTLPETSRPHVILTTAYAEYAVDAFALGVTDYLVKPIAFERFLQAANRVLASLSASSAPPAAVSPTPNPEVLTVKTGGKQYRLPVEEIRYIQGLRENVLVCTPTRQLIVHTTLRELEQQLPPPGFLRAHKSYLVNLRQVNFREGMELVLYDGTRIPVGQTYKDAVDEVF